MFEREANILKIIPPSNIRALIGVLVKDIANFVEVCGADVWGSIPGSIKSAQCRQRLAIDATFLRSCVAQALSRRNEPSQPFHASA